MNADPQSKYMIGQLYDLYGDLLTGRQKDVVDLCCNDDLSLSEVAQECGITRQGVRDALKKAEEQLFFWEEKLRLLEKQKKTEEVLRDALAMLEKPALGDRERAALQDRLKELLQF